MDETGKLIQSIVSGMREKKAVGITVVDMTSIDEAVCSSFVICQADTPNQLLAITDSIRESARRDAGQKPVFVDGENFAHWIAMDYGQVMVHLFVPELRKFYDLEHLWADAQISNLPDED